MIKKQKNLYQNKELLITPTLLNSFEYFLKNGNYEDFLNLLKRISIKKECLDKGNEYEELLCNKKIKDEFTPYIEGALFQVPLKKYLNIDGINFVIYGKADAIKENYIYDIKYTSNYRYLKFFNSFQHKIYMYCSGIENFKYLINENYQLYYVEEYNYKSSFETDIVQEINKFIDYLDYNKEAQENYLNIFNKKQ